MEIFGVKKYLNYVNAVDVRSFKEQLRISPELVSIITMGMNVVMILGNIQILDKKLAFKVQLKRSGILWQLI